MSVRREHEDGARRAYRGWEDILLCQYEKDAPPGRPPKESPIHDVLGFIGAWAA